MARKKSVFEKVADKEKSKPTSITQYIKKSTGDIRGVMAAFTDGQSYSLGYSLVNKAAGDKFDRERGIKQAITRAQRNLKRVNLDGLPVPPSILASVVHFEKRAEKYFKDKTKAYTAIISQADVPKTLTPKEQAELVNLFQPDNIDALRVLAARYDGQIPRTVLNILDRHNKNK